MKKVQDRWKKICKFLLKILLWILGILLFPVILIILALLFLWKNVLLRFAVKFLKPKFLRPLTYRDGFYASDRFWEDSRSSLGMIAILNGNVCIDKFRQEFTRKILDSSLESEAIFARLTQIPTSFGGYYFWQKANYFLIHEHIRQIEQPIDEAGLKKFAGTLMTLPFPNKRPLWEILIFPSFNTNCSAVVIRIHQAVTDPEGLMNLLASLSNGKIKEMSGGGESHEGTSADKPTTLGKVRETLKIPQFLYNFFDSLSKVPNSKLGISRTGTGDVVASWNQIHELSMQKPVNSQNLRHSSAVGLSIFSETILHSAAEWCTDKTVPGPEFHKEKFEPQRVQLESDLMILVPVASPEKGFAMVKNCESGSSSSIHRLKHIDMQIQNSLENKDPKISVGLLKILSLLPRHLLRLILSQPLQGATFIFQEFRSEIRTVSDAPESGGSTLDLIYVGENQLLDLVPLVGLGWGHTALAAATVKFQNKVTMSLILNSGLLKSHEKQQVVDELVVTLPDELDHIFEDGQDENGFISIPII